MNAADMTSRHHHDLRTVCGEPCFSLILLFEIEFGTAGLERRDASLFKRPHDGAADHAILARDEDAFAFE
jgi:hypothetical protein